MNEPKHHMTVKKEKRIARTIEVNKTAYGTPKTMMKLQARDCRWPVGELFCAAPISKGSYCSKHASISHEKKKARA